MKASRDLLLFIAVWEVLVTVAYEDGTFKDTGKPRWSKGFGDNSAREGETITPLQACKDLVANVRAREKVVQKVLKQPVTQHQYDAIMSAYYQGGTRNLLPLAAAVNAGQADQIPDILPLLDTNREGEHKPGLKLRREAEARIARDGDYGPLSPLTMHKGNPRKTRRIEYVPTEEEQRVFDDA